MEDKKSDLVKIAVSTSELDKLYKGVKGILREPFVRTRGGNFITLDSYIVHPLNKLHNYAFEEFTFGGVVGGYATLVLSARFKHDDFNKYNLLKHQQPHLIYFG